MLQNSSVEEQETDWGGGKKHDWVQDSKNIKAIFFQVPVLQEPSRTVNEKVSTNWKITNEKLSL